MTTGSTAWRRAALVAALWLAAACGVGTQPGPVDLLVTGGRVMDPESGLDAVASVAVRDGVIVSVGEERPEAREVLDATGLVVAPGFVDLHAHGQDPVSQRYQARDGVTTAMELEIGVYPVDTWYAEREGRALINYGATVSHQGARREAFGAVQTERNDEGTFTLGRGGAYLYEEASEEEVRRVARLMQAGLDQGALGFGFGVAYTPGASHEELWRLFAAAAERGAPVFIHLRSAGAFASREAIAPFQEAIANAAATGASLHIVHMNSSAGESAPAALELMRGARAQGVDVTTEAYPYTASASLIESALFDGWRGRSARLLRPHAVGRDRRAADRGVVRPLPRGGRLGHHPRPLRDHQRVDRRPARRHRGQRRHPLHRGPLPPPRRRHLRPHPRPLRPRPRRPVADGRRLRKMTLLPAQRLEQVTPQMAAKGRVQAGADADLTLFDPGGGLETVIDRATYDAVRPTATRTGFVPPGCSAQWAVDLTLDPDFVCTPGSGQGSCRGGSVVRPGGEGLRPVLGSGHAEVR